MSSVMASPIVEFEHAAGERLAMVTGAMARRLADLLDRALPANEAPASRDFLRAMARESGDTAVEWRLQGVSHGLDRLVREFGLTPVEVDLVVLAGLADEHEGYAGILRTLHPMGDPHPTAGLAAQLMCADASERRELRSTLETGVAVRNRIVHLGDPTAPFFERSILLAESLWSALHGLDVWPAGITIDPRPVSTTGLRAWLGSPAALRGRRALQSDHPGTILVTAETAEIAQERAAALVSEAHDVPVQIVLSGEVTVDIERLISVHAVVRGVVPVVRIPEAAGPGGVEVPAFAGHPGPMVVSGRFGSVLVRGHRPVLEVSADRLTPTARKELWAEAIPELAGEAPTLAARYTLEPTTAIAAASDARAMARTEDRDVRLDDLALAVHTRSGLALSSGVRLIRPTATWEQLVLPERRMTQLREALDRLVHQPKVLDEWGFLAGRTGARGVRMLFAGASGTGKTFSSEVLAGTLGVDLLMVDISRVVSKWIGETEKNLAEVFDAAERAQAVLLFDEADALFGKRTEVSDAHDRYANLETAFLLSRLERFEGLVILSTNLRQNIDPAFMRRLEFILDFVEPGPSERAALWSGHLPAGAPIADDVDIRELASLYAVVGGFIRNAAVAAGFLAAAEGTPITRTHIVRAIRREYEKSGRAFPGYPAGMPAP